MKTWLQLILAVAMTGALMALGWAWRSERQARAALEQQLRTAKSAIAEAAQRQKARDAALDQTLAALEKKKSAVKTTRQIMTQLPLDLHLPAPLRLEPQSLADAGKKSVPSTAASAAHHGTSTSQNSSPRVILPAEDLKPLYDFTVDCQECKAKLDAAEKDLADEHAKSAALAQQRDAALKLAKGGSLWRRMGRVAKWLLVGAAAGAIAAEAARHH